MQLNGKNETGPARRTLAELDRGAEAVILDFNLAEDVSRRLMELGFLPGGVVRAGRAAPSGDPRVFEVDGSQVALRRETASCIWVDLVEPPR